MSRRAVLSFATALVGALASGLFFSEWLTGKLGVLWMLVALLATGLAAWDGVRVLRADVRSWRDTFAALGSGDYSRRVGRGIDGELAPAFDRMAETLQRRHLELRSAADELKARIDARTNELRTAEEQILRSRRLTAIGSLGAGIAHELGNPLTAVLGIAGLLERQLEKDPKLAESVRLLADEARRIVKVMDDFKKFVEHEQKAAGEPVSLLRAIKDALEIFRERMEAQPIKLWVQFGGGLPQVQGQRDRLHTMVCNIVQNALDAMPNGGTLRLRLSALGGDAVQLIVSDTGRGIPADIRDRIFDPFFSTKGSREHAGMGLAIAHSVVTSHHGKIDVDSSEGRGTTFTVVLPAAAEAAHLY
jgi:two-component system, NtrC family, sensor kinase